MTKQERLKLIKERVALAKKVDAACSWYDYRGWGRELGSDRWCPELSASVLCKDNNEVDDDSAHPLVTGAPPRNPRHVRREDFADKEWSRAAMSRSRRLCSCGVFNHLLLPPDTPEWRYKQDYRFEPLTCEACGKDLPPVVGDEIILPKAKKPRKAAEHICSHTLKNGKRCKTPVQVAGIKCYRHCDPVAEPAFADRWYVMGDVSDAQGTRDHR